MNKETFFSILRAMLTIAGSFLIGKTVFGTQVDESLWQSILGGALFVGSTIWAVWDKTVTEEQFASAIRQLITFAGGLAVAAGKLKTETLLAIIGVVPLIAPVFLSWISKMKSINVAKGKIAISDLSGVKEEVDDGNLKVKPKAV